MRASRTISSISPRKLRFDISSGIAKKPRFTTSLTNNLHQHSLLAAPVELAVEDLLPRPEIELAFAHRDHHLATHHLALHVRVGIVLASPVVHILRDRLERGQGPPPQLRSPQPAPTPCTD